MNNSEVVQDFRRRYEGTWVFLKMENKGVETLVKVHEVSESFSKVAVLNLESSEHGMLTINLGSEGHSLRFKYPSIGVFQHGRDALTFRRRPTRQYRRGVCPDNSSMGPVTRNFAGNFVAWTTNELKSAFDHNTFTPKEALVGLSTSKMRSVALADNFAISESVFEGEDYVVWNWHYPIARLSKAGKIVHVYENVFEAQLSQLERDLAK